MPRGQFLKSVLIMSSVLISTQLLVYCISSANGFLISDIISGVIGAGKIITNPATQIGTQILDITCKSIKHLLNLRYKQMITQDSKPDVSKLSIYMTTSGDMEHHDISQASRTVLKSNHYDKSKKMVIIIHGFISNPRGPIFTGIGRALYETSEYNVLALDESELIGYFYLRSTTYIKFIGEKLGKLLVKFVEAGVPLNDITLVGHSLGAHVAGFAGKTYYKKTGNKIPRILALDPAGICFGNIPEKSKINKNNAVIVDVIHTNGGSFGLMEPIGHRDFYPNGGQTQRGCLGPICDHSRSWQIVIESIRNKKAFLAKQCDSWIQFLADSCHGTKITAMGFEIDPSAPDGTYYLWTESRPPLGLGEKGVDSLPFA